MKYLRHIIAATIQSMLNLSSMPIPYSDTDLLQHALVGLEHRKEEIDQAITSIRSRLHSRAPKRAIGSTQPRRAAATARKRRHFSAAARKRLSLLAKQRWAKAKKAGKKGL